MENRADLKYRKCGDKCSVPGNDSVDLDDEHDKADALVLRVYEKSRPVIRNLISIPLPPNTISLTIKMLLNSGLPQELCQLRILFDTFNMGDWPITLGYSDCPFFVNFHGGNGGQDLWAVWFQRSSGVCVPVVLLRRE